MGAHSLHYLILKETSFSSLSEPAFPWYDPQNGQKFPFRTLAMFISLASHLGVSAGARQVFRKNLLPPNMDIFHCFKLDPQAERRRPQNGAVNLAFTSGDETFNEKDEMTAL